MPGRMESVKNVTKDKGEIDAMLETSLREFFKAEIDRLVRSVVYRLQRTKASGIYGDDMGHRSLWDEYCHEVQHGPHAQLHHAWTVTLNPIIEDRIDKSPHHIVVLLSIHARRFDDSVSGDRSGPFLWVERLREEVASALASVAAWRDLTRLNSE